MRAYTSLSDKDCQVTFESLKAFPHQSEIIQRIKKWTPEMRKGIVLYGTVGGGKSTLCKAIINRWASSKYTCLFTSMPKAMQQLRDCIGDKSLKMAEEHAKLIKPHLLVIDDLGAEKASDWATEKIFMIIEERASLQKHTFFTTNLSKEEVQAVFKERIYSRLLEFCTWILVKGPDLRRQTYVDEF